jgi:hypothetical protein
MLTNLQKKIVASLAPYKSEDSYFAGGSILNLDCLRFSQDIDIFHDNHEQSTIYFARDIRILRKDGFYVELISGMEKGGTGEVLVSDGCEKTIIQWTTDSSYRFFPLIQDNFFGFRLHHVDAATNKVLALAGRSDVIRDYYDICTMIANSEPVAAYIWAACDKDPGYCPNSLLERMSFHSKFREESLLLINAENKLTLRDCKTFFTTMVDDTKEKFAYMPCNEYGTLYLKPDDKSVFFPSLQEFREESFIRHKGSVRGSMPQFLVPSRKKHKS